MSSILSPSKIVFAQHSVQRGRDEGVVAYEAAVEASQAKKAAKVHGGGQEGPIQHGINLGRIWGNSGGRDDVAQVLQCGFGKNAFGSP